MCLKLALLRKAHECSRYYKNGPIRHVMEEAVNIDGPNPSPSESCHLHQAVFKNDLPALSALLRGIKDKNNTANKVGNLTLKELSTNFRP